MPQYNVDFFNRNLSFAHNTLLDPVPIDDDYITGPINVIDIESTLMVVRGQFVRLKSEDYSFFGVVTDVSPGEETTRVSFKSFVNVFDEEVLFDTHLQGTGKPSTRPTLEKLIETYILSTYINTSDTSQRLPMTVTIDPLITQTQDWSFGYRSEDVDMHHKEVNLYSDIIVKALTKYGIAVVARPIFGLKKIELTITKRPNIFKISGDLPSVNVKTLRYNEQNTGVNKLVVYNFNNLSQSVTFYVHPDNTWDLNNTNRIVPVQQSVKIVTPEDATSEAFAEAALEAAYSALAGLEYDNLIELETYVDDVNVAPIDLVTGQMVAVWYQGASYSSILTGRILDGSKITLLFGSDRIEFTKRRKLRGGT